jgi:hypothetical protein
MDLDHLHSKIVDLAAAARKLTFEEIDTEIKKCRLLCALCHRAYTFGVDSAPLPVDGAESNLPISQTLPDIEGWRGRRRL